MPTHFFTNDDGNTLIQKFEGTFEHNPGIQFFDALVGYFRASGYFLLRPFLDKVPHIRVLVGIDVDRLTGAAHQKGLEFFANHDKTREEFLAFVAQDIEKAIYDDATEKGILQFIDDIVKEKIELRAHPEKRIHAKVYLFYQDIHNKHNKQCSVITGSSNLTGAGLGGSEQHNYEFNVELSGYDDVHFAWHEFENLWKDSVPILPVDANGIRRQSYLKDDFTPLQLYIKMLIEYFGVRVEYDPYNIALLLPPKYMRLKYQTDAATQGYAMMMKHNGFLLADVVGLGKTIIAAMVIKKFIYENGSHTKVLIVCPPAIKAAWQRTANDFLISNHLTYVTVGSLHQVLDEENLDVHNAEQYDLVVIDESHKFRNDYTDMYVALQEICKTPRIRAGENGDTRKKVILVSATPLNNRPQDIENQLYLFQDRRNSTLDTIPQRNLQDYFKPINEKYKQLAAAPELDLRKLKDLFNKLRNEVIEPLVIRRTRKDIENTEEYKQDLKDQGIIFPKVKDPKPLEYDLDAKLTRLFLDTVDVIAGVDAAGNPLPGALGYYRYRAIENLVSDEDRKTYGNVRSISDRLSGIMRILLVKRLESSFTAFKGSLGRLQQAYQNMLEMFAAGRIFIAPDLDVNKLLEEEKSYDDILEIAQRKGGNNREFSEEAFKDDFIEKLKEDKQKIDKLVQQWAKVQGDPKLKAFLGELKNTFFNARKNKSKKLVIFTESTETAAELVAQLKAAGYDKVLSVSAANRSAVDRVIRYNFDANVEEEDWEHEYDVIITTEVLAEGVNLHRSNTIINYDVPWNSTRLMQRIGRVNRIGSRASEIFVYNYYPSAEGDAEIRLVNNALRKLQAFHSAFGEDNRIFSMLEEVGDGALHGGSRLQEEESEILKYLTFLRKFKKQDPKKYRAIEKIPNKARTGRSTQVAATIRQDWQDSDDNIAPELATSTISYLKAENHPGIFCLVTEAMNAYPLSFLEAARLFTADEAEKREALHALHHEQANKAYDYFKEESVQSTIPQAGRQQLSNVENKAVTNLVVATKQAQTPQQREVLQQTLKSIRAGVHNSRGLPKQLNDFFVIHERKLSGNPHEFFQLLFAEVLNNPAPVSSAAVETRAGIVNPLIVLSLSFN